MCLVNKQLVNAQFLKGHEVILAGLVIQPVELLLNLFLAALQLLDRESVAVVLLHLHDALHDLVALLLQIEALTTEGQGNLFKLAVADDDGVVLSGRNASAEAFAVFRFKVLCRCHKNIRGGVELQILCRPLLCEVVRDHKQALVA